MSYLDWDRPEDPENPEPRVKLPPVGLTMLEQMAWIKATNPKPNPFTQPHYQQAFTEAIDAVVLRYRNAMRQVVHETHDEDDHAPDPILMDDLAEFLTDNRADDVDPEDNDPPASFFGARMDLGG